MRTITKWPIVSLFTSAKKHFFGFFSFIYNWAKFRTFVRCIAEWLFRTFSTCTPIIGFILAFNVVSNDTANNNYYYDFTNSLSGPNEVTIDGDTYNSWSHEFDFYKDPDPTNSEWIYVEIEFYNSDNWDHCSASNNNFDSVSSIDDGILWYDLDCYGDIFENTQGYVSYDGSTFTFAVDTTISPTASRVDGEFMNDIDDEISLVIIPILMVIIYIGLLIYSFNSGKKELGYGLLTGLLTGGLTFCFSAIILSAMFYNDF